MKTRHPSRSRATLALILVLSIGPWLGCKPAEEEPTERSALDAGATPRRGGTLVIGAISDIDGVNEVISGSSRMTDEVVFRMFLSLADEQPDFEDHPPTFEPELAESWEWSDDRLELTFHLREDAVWSDGHPITAEDVRFSWRAQTHPDVAWPAGYFKGAIEDVEVVDPHTVTFHFSRVSPYQLLEAIEGVILPKHAWGELPFSEWRQRGDFFVDNLVVSGPFTLERWTPQQEIVLVRNERYFEPDLPHLDRVVFRVIPERSGQVTQLLGGGIHVVDQLSRPDVPRVRASERAEVHSFWHRLYAFVAWNLDREPFGQRTVRQALTLGIDRQQIVDTLWGEFGRVATSPIVRNVWAHDETIEAWPYDPERARRLLAEAGWADRDGDGVLERDGRPFRFDLISNQGNQERIDAMVMVQEQLRRIGVDARPRVVEFNAMLSMLDERDFDAVVGGYGMPTTLDLRYAFHTDSIVGGNNPMGYSDPQVDELIERVERLPDIAQAEPLLHELQQIIHRDQPMTLLWESQRINGYHRRVHPHEPNLLSTFWFLRHWWIEPEE